jgi:mannose-1-phosphate guanylyltransferase
VVRAFEAVAAVPDRIVMLGIAPSTLQYGYGWIEPGETLTAPDLRTVKHFWEKPNEHLTQYLHSKGCLWNTMTAVGRAELLLGLMEATLPGIVRPMREIIPAIGTSSEAEVTEAVFASLPSANFSRGLLQRIPEQLGVLRMHGVYWNDWGDEQRILADIESFGQQRDPSVLH